MYDVADDYSSGNESIGLIDTPSPVLPTVSSHSTEGKKAREEIELLKTQLSVYKQPETDRGMCIILLNIYSQLCLLYTFSQGHGDTQCNFKFSTV